MISARHLPAICAMAALALVPAAIHGGAGTDTDDGRRASGLPPVLAGHSSEASDRGDTWGDRRFNSDDWIERHYAMPDGEATLTVVRSYDLKTLYHHPELAVADDHPFTAYVRARLAGRPDVPIHVLRAGGERRATAIYALHYDRRFVERPFLFQIQIAGELLFSRRKPMTLFFVLAPGTPDDARIDDLGASRLLAAAIDSFLEQRPARLARGDRMPARHGTARSR